MNANKKPLLNLKNQSHRQQLGKRGEAYSADYLKKNGYTVVARNFRGRYGELDIIATKEHTIVFVEVKTRIGTEYGSPEEAVTPRKLQDVIKTSQFFLSMYPKYATYPARIDVIAIEVTHEGKILQFNHMESVTS